MVTEAVQPIHCTPLGKPRRKTHEDAPIEIPEEWPTTVPVEPSPVRVPQPA